MLTILIWGCEHSFFSLLDMHSSSASSPVPDRGPEPNPTLAQALSAAPTPSAPHPTKVAKPFGYGYPTLQPAYQNAAPPPAAGGHPSGPAYSGYPQVCFQSCLIN